MLTGPSVHIKDIEVHALTDLKYNFSEEEVKPYFSEDRVLQGAFDVATKLFDITFVERNDDAKVKTTSEN